MNLRLVVVVYIAGCGFGDGYSGPGVLGTLTFEPKSGTLIAVGAQFVVVTSSPADLKSADSNIAAAALQPRWFASSTSAVFEAKAVGIVSIIAGSPDAGRALDYIDVDLRTPDKLSLALGGDAFHNDNTVTAYMTGASTPLNGDFGCKWSVSDETVASMTTFGGESADLFWLTGQNNTVRLKVLTPGAVTITATCLGITQSVTQTFTLDGGAISDASADATEAGDADAADGDAGDATDDASDAADD